MCAGFNQDLRQRQNQSLVLAPQLRQSLKILQVAALDLRSAVSALPMPIRLIWGDADAIIPAAHAESVGRSTILPGAGHMAHVERPAEVAALVRGLVAEAERAPALVRS